MLFAVAARARVLAAVAWALLAATAAGCSLLVSFDTRADAGCYDDAACVTASIRIGDGGGDATNGTHTGPDRDAPGAVDQLPGATLDVGDCAALGEGAACAKPSACQMPATCKGGLCTENPIADGTGCGAPPDVCHDAPVCMGGVCAAPATVPDGTACGKAPDACHKPPGCTAGVCGAPAIEPDTTACGPAPDACHDAPLCAAGACGAAKARADGTLWNAKDPNAMCCAGKPVETTTTDDCGVCGWACGAGQGCGVVDGEYLCTGCTADTECFSGCCSLTPSPNHCSASDCAGACQSPDICPDGSHCVVGASVVYCAY